MYLALIKEADFDHYFDAVKGPNGGGGGRHSLPETKVQ